MRSQLEVGESMFRGIRKAYGWVLFICMFMSLTVGCTSEVSEDTSELRTNKATQITVEPVDLFSGEGAKFKPFLGEMSGAVKLSYNGEQPNAALDIDIWQNGKKVSSQGSIGDLFLRSSGRENREVEVIISIDTLNIEAKDRYTVKVGTFNGTGSGLTTFTLPRNEKMTVHGLISESEERTFEAQGAVPIWGMQSTSSNMIQSANLSAESLNRLEWALVITLRFKD